VNTEDIKLPENTIFFRFILFFVCPPRRFSSTLHLIFLALFFGRFLGYTQKPNPVLLLNSSSCPFTTLFLSSMFFSPAVHFLLSSSQQCSSSSVPFLLSYSYLPSSVRYSLFFLYLPIFPCSLNLFLFSFPCYLYRSFISLSSHFISYSFSISLLSVYVPQVQDYRFIDFPEGSAKVRVFQTTIAFARKHTFFLSFSLPIFPLSLLSSLIPSFIIISDLVSFSSIFLFHTYFFPYMQTSSFFYLKGAL
jgi:hypothetical protein